MWTYLLSNGASVKIGRTNSIKSRINQLQLSSPQKLELLLLLEGDHEKLLHTMFSEIRQHGEWFELTPLLQAYIDKQRKDHYERWLISCLLKEQRKQNQVLSEEQSQWHPLLQEAIEALPVSVSGRKQITSAKLWVVLGIEKEQRDRRSCHKIANMMRAQGFRHTRLREEGTVQVGYVRDTDI